MGFHLHNRGGGFSLDPKHPNALAPRKRPFHTIIPAFLEKGNLHIGFGIMGGSNQPQAHAQFVSNLVDFKMNLQAAMEAPRFSKRVLGDCTVSVEGRMKPEVREALARRGHKLDVRADYSMQVGRGEAVMHDAAAKVNYGASSAQGDGAAMPEPAPRQP
ncbi:MAG: gamma-glutamyltransferase, partial [Acidobacteria bacterium]|nr:gamma-glutamyltransferase [Acidobacteriota bacterium]